MVLQAHESIWHKDFSRAIVMVPRFTFDPASNKGKGKWSRNRLSEKFQAGNPPNIVTEVVQQRETSKWYYYGCYRVVHSSYVPMAQVREIGDVLVCSVQCN